MNQESIVPLPPLGDRPTIVWLGPCTTIAQRDCRAICAAAGSVIDSPSALATLRVAPDLCVVALNRPGEVTGSELAGLRQRFSAMPVVAVLESWCEGETRTGRPLDDTLRLYAHEAAAWFEQRLLHTHTRARALRLAICSPSPRWLETWCELLDGLGHLTIGYLSDAVPWFQRLDALLWDVATPLVARQMLARPRQLAPSVPMIALVDFPREAEILNWYERGITRVVGKPARVETIVSSLYAALQTTPERRAA